MSRNFLPQQVRMKLVSGVALGSVVVTTAIVMASIGTSDGIESEPVTVLRQRLLPNEVLRAQTVPLRETVVVTAPDRATSQVEKIAVEAPSARQQRAKPTSQPSGPVSDLASAERIQLRVRGYPELSGEYRINPDMTISVNGIGRMSVGSMTAAAFEAFLGEKFSSELRRDVSVAVEVVRFRSFFVTGQVAQPGAIEWRPDLTLIQAISLSGGIVRNNAGAQSFEAPERSLAQQQARAQMRFSLAQLSRLRAEREGKEHVEGTNGLEAALDGTTPESRQAVQEFMSRQNSLLNEQRALLLARISRLEKDQESAKSEFEAAELQANEIKRKIDITTELMQGLETLKKQNLVPNQRYLAHHRDLIDTRVRYSEARVAVERARNRIGSLAREIEAVQQERRALINDRIETLERDVLQNEISVSNASTDARVPQEVTTTVSYHIARKGPSGVQTVAAHLFSEVHPGDVIIVSSQQRAQALNTSRGTPVASSTAAPGSLERTQQILESSASTGLMPMLGRLFATRIGGSN